MGSLLGLNWASLYNLTRWLLASILILVSRFLVCAASLTDFTALRRAQVDVALLDSGMALLAAIKYGHVIIALNVEQNSTIAGTATTAWTRAEDSVSTPPASLWRAI